MFWLDTCSNLLHGFKSYPQLSLYPVLFFFFFFCVLSCQNDVKKYFLGMVAKICGKLVKSPLLLCPTPSSYGCCHPWDFLREMKLCVGWGLRAAGAVKSSISFGQILTHFVMLSLHQQACSWVPTGQKIIAFRYLCGNWSLEILMCGRNTFWCTKIGDQDNLTSEDDTCRYRCLETIQNMVKLQ